MHDLAVLIVGANLGAALVLLVQWCERWRRRGKVATRLNTVVRAVPTHRYVAPHISAITYQRLNEEGGGTRWN